MRSRRDLLFLIGHKTEFVPPGNINKTLKNTDMTRGDPKLSGGGGPVFPSLQTGQTKKRKIVEMHEEEERLSPLPSISGKKEFFVF
jgi:hypothetical protein